MKEVKQLLMKWLFNQRNFHWHLYSKTVDGEVEIKKYPRSQKLGAQRFYSAQLAGGKIDGKLFDGYSIHSGNKEIISMPGIFYITVVPGNRDAGMPSRHCRVSLVRQWQMKKLRLCTFGSQNSAFNVADPRTRTL